MNEPNNWYVLTGAPCSGKTTILRLLEKKGFQVVPELARVYIDEEIAKGRTIEQIRENELLFQKKILQFKIDHEKTLPKEKIIFFDRGIPDSAAYYKLIGAAEDIFLGQAVLNSSYKKVFLFDFVEYGKDYARTETKEEQIKLQGLLEEAYQRLNIPIIKVPVVPKPELVKRLNFILDNL